MLSSADEVSVDGDERKVEGGVLRCTISQSACLPLLGPSRQPYTWLMEFYRIPKYVMK